MPIVPAQHAEALQRRERLGDRVFAAETRSIATPRPSPHRTFSLKVGVSARLSDS